MFSRIWAFILSILISIFPGLGGQPNEPKLDVNASVEIVINAIKTRDIDAIEAFMCKNIKDNVPNLREEIGNAIDAIEGTVASSSSTSSNVFYGSAGGKTIEQAISNSTINTTVANYRLTIQWEFYNNFSIEERGIRWFALSIPTDSGYETLVRIRATEGVGSMHG